jgi:hypothetical protein
MKSFKITRYEYEVYEDDCYESGIVFGVDVDQSDFAISATGRITAKKGYMWDGCSGPTIERKQNHRAGLYHDILAEAMRMGLIPQSFWTPANEMLGRICVEDGMSPWWAKNVYVRGVSLTNNWCRVTGKPEHVVFEAP